MPIFSHARQVQAKLQLSENIFKIAGKLYISTARVISGLISLKFCEMADSGSMGWKLLGFLLSFLGFLTMKSVLLRILYFLMEIGHSVGTRNR